MLVCEVLMSDGLIQMLFARQNRYLWASSKSFFGDNRPRTVLYVQEALSFVSFNNSIISLDKSMSGIHRVFVNKANIYVFGSSLCKRSAIQCNFLFNFCCLAEASPVSSPTSETRRSLCSQLCCPTILLEASSRNSRCLCRTRRWAPASMSPHCREQRFCLCRSDQRPFFPRKISCCCLDCLHCYKMF